MTAVSRSPDLGTTGLGLGGIRMPVELGGPPPVLEIPQSDSRYQSFRPRHSPSHSSPPSLAPFAASVKTSSALSASSAPVPTPINARKYSLQNLSGDIISYPMVSRIDLAPTYTPPPAPPVPVSQTSSKSEATASSELKKAPKIRPPPIKVPTSTHSSFLSPFKAKFGAKDKDGKGISPEREKEAEGQEKLKSKTKKSKADARIEENKAAFAAQFPDTLAKLTLKDDDDDEDTLNISLPPKPATPGPTSSALARSASKPERVPVPALASPFGLPDDPTSPSRPSHRRATSDESPQIVQNAFARAEGAVKSLRDRPATVYSANPSASGRRPSRISPFANPLPSTAQQAPPAGSAASSRRASRSQSFSSTAGVPKPDDAFFPPSVGGASAAPAASSSRRPSAAPSFAVGPPAIGISVREGTSTAREIGRASFPEEGLSVSLRSYHRPDELEVGWVCVPSVDAEGRAYTAWEIRLRPRATQQAPSVPPLLATPAPKSTVRGRTPSTSGAGFLNYRMGAAPAPVAAVPPADSTGLFAPTSPRGGQRGGGARSVSPGREVPPAPRKYSARSEGSFSSESSTTGPTTPRRGKLSNASILSADLPPFDLDAVLASKSSIPPLPFSATSYTFDPDDLTLPGSRRRTVRASSYASEQFRARQFSIDEEGIMSRAASFSVGPSAIASQPKSPKHHRFGCYIPPINPGNGEDFVEMAKEAKRRSASSIASGLDRSDEPPVPVSRRKQSIAGGPVPPLPTPPVSAALSDDSPPRSFLSTRGGRRQSVAPPAALVIPANPSNPERISPSSAFTPSPLRTVNRNSASSDGHGEIPTPAAGKALDLPPVPALPVLIPFPAHLSAPAADAVSIASTTPPSPPPTAVPTKLLFPPRPTSSGNASAASPTPSNGSGSSFGNAAPGHPRVGRLAGPDMDLALGGSGEDLFSPELGLDGSLDAHGDADEDEEEGADAAVFEAKLVRARQARRLASKWSDTETEDDDDEDGPGATSWSNIPDAESE
ncbi:hypothetical protein JCM10207_002664 [Rhodosporidiobolus poonsookiae]